MGSEIQISFIGAFLAFLFTASMTTLLWWMLHVPRAIPQAAAKARRAVGAIKRVLVPTSGTLYSERGIELACRLGEEQKAEIYLITVIEVPAVQFRGAISDGRPYRDRQSSGSPLEGNGRVAKPLLYDGLSGV